MNKDIKNIQEPSIVTVVIMLLIAVGIFYIFKNYSLEDLFNFFKIFVENNPILTYLIAFLAAVAEGTVIISLVPGSLTILVFGAIAATGSLNISLLYPVVVLGAVVGDNIGYYLGGYFGSRIIKSGFIDPMAYKMAQNFVAKHGKKSIAFSRFVGGMKELAPFIAGTVKMNKKDFIIYNFIGALGWALVWLGFGYIFYQAIGDAENYLKKILFFLSVLFTGFIAYYLYKNQNLFEKNDNKNK